MLTPHTHPETREACFVLHDFTPPARFAARERHGVHGRPLLSLWVYAARVELERAWCFSSGHMEAYEQETAATFQRGPEGWPDALSPAVADWFGAEVAAATLRVLADPRAFAPERGASGA